MAFAALSGCAAIGNPDGGAFDETPPRITSTHPKNGATGYDGHKVTIDFNEFIKLENASEKVVISPPQTEQPEIKVTGKKIQVELFDSLKPNTTYSIDFADGIVDNNEGNPLGDFCFRFSTGDAIDTLEVSGYVLNAQNLDPVKGITVGLHKDLSDSAFMTKPFDRVSRTDANGHFTVRGIAPGSYRIYAVMDMDQTFSYSQRNEQIAWMDSIIVPASETRYRDDTIFTAQGTVDTVMLVQYTKYTPEDITLMAFTPQPVIQYMTNATRDNHEKFTLQFALPLDSMPVVKGINFDERDAYILQHSARYDTLTFWMKDTLIYYKDTLQISLTYLATDTLGLLSPTTDTIKLITKKSREKILKEQAKKEEEQRKEREKKLKKLDKNGDTLGIAELLKPVISYIDANLTTGSGLSVYQNIYLDFKEPVTFLTDTSIHVRQKVDTLWVDVPYEIEHDTLNILRYRIYAEWKPASTFKIEIDSASIQGLYGRINNTINSTLQFNSLDKFSTMTVTVSNPKPGYTVQIRDSRSVVRAGKLTNGSIDFFLLKPGKYYVSMFDDVNMNGKWDTGDYETKQQPEKVWYLNKEFTLKADWTHEAEWNPNDMPPFQQKPQALNSNKSTKKTTNAHQRNIDRLEKKNKQIESEKKKKERKRKERKERRMREKLKYQNIRAKNKESKSKTQTETEDYLETEAETENPQVEQSALQDLAPDV